MKPLRQQQQGSELEIWCEVYRSAHRSAGELVATLWRCGTILSSGSYKLINRFKQQPLLEVENYKLIKITLEELGLPDKSTWGEIYVQADSKGLLLCPSWVGHDLCIQKKDLIEPNEQYFIVLFEGAPSKKSYFRYCISSYSSHSRVLRVFAMKLYTVFRSNDQFIFIAP